MLKGQIDFKSEPWPKISEAAKDCVRRLLEMDASKRATSEQVREAWLHSNTHQLLCDTGTSKVQGTAGRAARRALHVVW